MIIIFDFAGTLVRMRPATLLIPKSLLRRIAQKYKLGIITGGKRAEVRNIIKKLKINQYFRDNLIITKDDTLLRKPDPRLLQLIMKRSGNKKVVYIGDRITDYIMARDAQVPFFQVTRDKSIEQIAAILLSSRSIL